MLELAVKDGFSKDNILYDWFIKQDWDEKPEIVGTDVLNGLTYDLANSYSLNDLILNTNFFECLFGKERKHIGYIEYEGGYTEPINKLADAKITWCLLPVEERLKWLLNQFNL